MTIFGFGGRDTNFVHSFYERELSEDDLLVFDAEKMKVSKMASFINISRFLGKESSSVNSQGRLQQLYREVSVLSHKIHPSDDAAKQLFEKNSRRLIELAYLPEDLMSDDAYNQTEEELKQKLKEGGFTKSAQDEIASISVRSCAIGFSVPDRKNLTAEEESVCIQTAERQRKIALSKRSVVEGGDQRSLHLINPEAKLVILSEIQEQLEKDVSRGQELFFFTSEGALEMSIDSSQIPKADANYSREVRSVAIHIMKYVEGLPGISANQQLALLDHCCQGMYNQTTDIFFLTHSGPLEAFFQKNLPREGYSIRASDRSPIIQDIEKKEGRCALTLEIVDTQTTESILKFRVHSKFNWETQQMHLRSRLIFVDASPFWS